MPGEANAKASCIDATLAELEQRLQRDESLSFQQGPIAEALEVLGIREDPEVAEAPLAKESGPAKAGALGDLVDELARMRASLSDSFGTVLDLVDNHCAALRRLDAQPQSSAPPASVVSMPIPSPAMQARRLPLLEDPSGRGSAESESIPPPALPGVVASAASLEEQEQKDKRDDVNSSQSAERFDDVMPMVPQNGRVAEPPQMGMGNQAREQIKTWWLNKQSKPGNGASSRRHTSMFFHAEMMKQHVRDAVTKEELDLTTLYHTTGFCQNIARRPMFENVSVFVVFMNFVWMGIEVEFNSAASEKDSDAIFIVAEFFFLVFFGGEWLLRFGALAKKLSGFQDPWFRFDTVLVVIMVVETGLMQVRFAVGDDGGENNLMVLRAARVLRITRTARVARLLRSLPEVWIIIKGISVAAKTVALTLAFLMVIVYVCAVTFMQLTDANTEWQDMRQTLFKSLADTMTLLLLRGILPDQAAVVHEMGAESFVLAAFMMLFIFAGHMIVMNMLVGILVEVVKGVSASEKEQMQVSFLMNEIHKFKSINEHGDHTISKEEFFLILQEPEACRALQDVGVDVVALVDSVDHIFRPGRPHHLAFREFMDAVLALRGSNSATVKDVLDMRSMMLAELAKAEVNIRDELLKGIEAILAKRQSHLC